MNFQRSLSSAPRTKPPAAYYSQESTDYELQKRIYALRSLPSQPTPAPAQEAPSVSTLTSIKRKPVRPDARVVVSTERFSMERQEQDTAQAQEHASLSTQGSALNNPITRDFAAMHNAKTTVGSSSSEDASPPRPPPKSPHRYGRQKLPVKGAAVQNRQSSQKIHQLMGAQIDVFDQSSTSRPSFERDMESDSSSIYSQDSDPSVRATALSWPPIEEDVPSLQSDLDGVSSRSHSWESKHPPSQIMPLRTRGVPHPLERSPVGPTATPSLYRKPRAQRRSCETNAMDNYHRIVTDLAIPRSRASADAAPAAATPSRPSQTLTGHDLRIVQSMYGESSFTRVPDGMPANFDKILIAPRPAPLPPQQSIRPGTAQATARPADEERMGSYFDFDSESDEEGRRGRDSLLGKLFPDRHRSASSGAAARVSFDVGQDDREHLNVVSNTTVAIGKKRHAPLKGLVGWMKKDPVAEKEKRKEELKQKITVQGGHWI